MPTLYETLENGSPVEIHDAVTTALGNIVESYLQEKRKMVITDIINKPFTLEETVKRAPWNKKTIREALENAALNNIRKKTVITEDFRDSKDWVAHATSHGWKHDATTTNHSGDTSHYTLSHPREKKSLNPISLHIIHKHGTGHTRFHMQGDTDFMPKAKGTSLNQLNQAIKMHHDGMLNMVSAAV